MVASTPPSLVKLASRLASLRMGSRSSTPTRDHVPDEMYANAGRIRGDRDDRGRGVVRPDERHDGRFVQPRRLAYGGQHPATDGARVGERRE